MSSTSVFAPIRAGSLVRTVRDQVRQAVLRGDIPPGGQLRDSVLAAQMGVSRAPVREALRLLERSGLVEKSANHPYSVKTFDHADLQELAVLRIALETVPARLIVRQKRDLSGIRSALSLMQNQWDSTGDTGRNDGDAQLHRALIVATGMPRLVEQYDDLVDQIVLAWIRLAQDVSRPSGNLAAHEEIVSTLERCQAEDDPLPIQQLLTDHVRSGMGCEDLIL